MLSLSGCSDAQLGLFWPHRPTGCWLCMTISHSRNWGRRLGAALRARAGSRKLGSLGCTSQGRNVIGDDVNLCKYTTKPLSEVLRKPRCKVQAKDEHSGLFIMSASTRFLPISVPKPDEAKKGKKNEYQLFSTGGAPIPIPRKGNGNRGV